MSVGCSSTFSTLFRAKQLNWAGMPTTNQSIPSARAVLLVWPPLTGDSNTRDLWNCCGLALQETEELKSLRQCSRVVEDGILDEIKLSVFNVSEDTVLIE